MSAARAWQVNSLRPCNPGCDNHLASRRSTVPTARSEAAGCTGRPALRTLAPCRPCPSRLPPATARFAGSSHCRGGSWASPVPISGPRPSLIARDGLSGGTGSLAARTAVTTDTACRKALLTYLVLPIGSGLGVRRSSCASIEFVQKTDGRGIITCALVGDSGR